MLLLTSFVLSINVATSRGDDASLAEKTVVWFADHQAIHAVDSTTNKIVHNISLSQEVNDILIDPNTRSLWVLSHKTLHNYNRNAE